MRRALFLIVLAGCGGGGGDADPDAAIPPYCGNAILDPGEVCDDGNLEGGDGCGPSCQPAECGNGVVDVAEGETCDDANTVDGDGCSTACRYEACGNGERDVGEVCDDGDHDDGDGCSATCASDETCGNGVVDVAVGEDCEDGNTADGDGCSSACTSGATCGAFRNGGFEGLAGWNATSAAIDLVAAGHAGPGIAVLPAAQCATASISQLACALPFATTGAMELVFWARQTATGLSRNVKIALGGAPPRLSAGFYSLFAEQSMCLGELAYGKLFEVAASAQFCAASPPSIELDDFALRVAAPGRCADPGTVLHGDFEDPVGWSAFGATTEIIDDGTGNHVLHLHGNGGTCGMPLMIGQISPPLGTTLPHVALQLTARSSTGGPLRLQFELGVDPPQQTFAVPSGDVATTVSMCVGPGVLGQAFPLWIQAAATTTVCANEVARDFVIDDLQLVSDPSCP